MVIIALIICQLKMPVIAALNPIYGDISHYNAIVQRDYTAGQADVEGAVAVGGNLHAPTVANQTYTVGGAYSGANGHHVGEAFDNSIGPTLMLGGAYKNSGSGLIVEGDVTTYLGNAIPPADTDILGKTNSVTQSRIHEQIKDMIDKANHFFSNIVSYTLDTPIDGGEGYNGSKIDFYTSKEDAKINIGIVDSALTSEIGELYLPSNIESQDFTIIYSPATTIHLLEGATMYDGNIVDINQDYEPDSTVSKVVPKIMYYFPFATSITSNSKAILGSVFAPNAHLGANGGSINGQGIFDSVEVTGGFEFHNFHFDWQRAFPDKTLDITKVDSENSHILLPGATFRLEDPDKHILGRVTTDTTGSGAFTGIPGTLQKAYLVEESAPDHYELPTGLIEVDLSDTSQQIFYKTITNKLELGSLTIQKKIVAPISGEIYDLNKIAVHLYGEGIDQISYLNTAGQLEIPNLKQGTYSLKEVAVPTNMVLNPTVQKLNIAAGQHTTFILSNKGISSTFGAWLTKINSMQQSLDGIPFELFMVKKDGTGISLGTAMTKSQRINNQLIHGAAVWNDLKISDFWTKAGDPLFSKVYVIERATNRHPEIQQDLTTKIDATLDYQRAIGKYYFYISSGSNGGSIVNPLKKESIASAKDTSNFEKIGGSSGSKARNKKVEDGPNSSEKLPQTGDSSDSLMILCGLFSLGLLLNIRNK